MLNALPVSAGNDVGEFQLRIKAVDFSLFSLPQNKNRYGLFTYLFVIETL